jgi:transcription antitermination factor NusG
LIPISRRIDLECGMGTQSVNVSPARRQDMLPGNMEQQRNWFAVFTRSHHEKRVAQYYAEREIEHLLPVSRVMRQWSHYRKVTVELPLFPNYLFVHISRRERTRALEVPGVLSLVGQNGVPAPLLEVEIESLRETLQVQNCAPHPYLVVGAKVRINKGALAGRAGIVLRHKNRCRVVLTLSLIMRSFAVEVDAADLDVLS